MKTLRYLILCTFTIWGILACNNPRSNDAESMAKKVNESKDTTGYIDIRGPGAEFPAIATHPYMPPTPSRKNLKRIEEFRNEKGSEFDKKYIDVMVSNHRSTIRLFENASRNASDVEIQKYASNALPILENHLETARQLKEKL